MTKLHVGTEEELRSGGRRIVTAADTEIAVFEHGGKIYAIENYCLHQGGPVGEGTLIGKVEANVSDGGELLGERFSETETHIVCPWHGWEYDIESGRHAGADQVKLRTFEVEREGGAVYVVI